MAYTQQGTAVIPHPGLRPSFSATAEKAILIDFVFMKPKLEKILLARKFRKEQTKSERIFWQNVKDRKFLGLKFRRQVVLQGFVVDFCCHEYKLIIEIDGAIHDFQKEYDQSREELLSRAGYTFFRVKSDKVEENVALVLEQLVNKIKIVFPVSALAEKGLGDEAIKK